MTQLFLGNKVTAYGGDLSVKLLYEGPGPGRTEPLIILRGNGITLVHRARDQESVFTPGREFTVTVPTYEQFYEHRDGRGPASREDLMMVLADLDLFLIRATHTDSQTSTRWGRVFKNYFWEILFSGVLHPKFIFAFSLFLIFPFWHFFFCNLQHMQIYI
ncbi:unnamed protein product [Meloidogyne enterolobii]|uniref:Uncharacterized protein n=1 Tax=Meloidogyne enterolobii TaxID=390850 RepID=A0ACB1AAB6_MELEN